MAKGKAKKVASKAAIAKRPVRSEKAKGKEKMPVKEEKPLHFKKLPIPVSE